MSDPVERVPAESTTRPTTACWDTAAICKRWAERLTPIRPAEQTVAAFCAAEGVLVPAFDQWKRTPAAEVPPASPPTFVPVQIAVPAAGPIEFARPNRAEVQFPAGTYPVGIVAVVCRNGSMTQRVAWRRRFTVRQGAGLATTGGVEGNVNIRLQK